MTFTVQYQAGYSQPVPIEVVRISAESYQGLEWLCLFTEDESELPATVVYMDDEGVLRASLPENF